MKPNALTAAFAAGFDPSLCIEVTTRCNSNCLHCFAHAGLPERSNLPVEMAKEIITEGYQTAYRRLHITGGEPLLWEGLFEIVGHAFDTGYRSVTINTNGHLLTKAVGRQLAEFDNLSISVSLEGPQSIHEHWRGRGSCRRAVRGIENSLDSGLDLVIFSVVGKSLLACLPRHIANLYRRFAGIHHVTLIQLINIAGNSFPLSEELLTPDDFIQLVRSVSLLNLYGLRTSVKHNPLAAVVAKLLGMPWVPWTQPLYNQGSIIVMADGNISLAHSSRTHFGRYSPGMINDILNSDAYRRAIAPDQTPCATCDHAALCLQNGMPRASERHLDMHPGTPYCKRVLDRIVPELSDACLTPQARNLLKV